MVDKGKVLCKQMPTRMNIHGRPPKVSSELVLKMTAELACVCHFLQIIPIFETS